MTVSMDKKYVTRNGLYDAKVVYIHDKGYHQPVVVFAENKDGGERPIAVWRAHLDGRFSCLHEHEHEHEHKYDLIEVPEDTQGGWVEFDAENDKMPFLHMHDMIEVEYGNGHQSPPIPAWSVNFDSSCDPVVAYRLVKKAEQPEKKHPPIEVFVDIAEAAENKVVSANHGLRPHQVANAAREAGVRAVLKLAGVKV